MISDKQGGPEALERFTDERQRLMSALGHLTEGGVVEDIQHIGATSVQGMPAQGVIDIAISIWPFPLAPEYRAKLEALGYEPAGEDRLRSSDGRYQLFFLEPGGDAWRDYLLMRDYWRENEPAREKYSSRDEASKAEYLREALQEARHWHIQQRGFTPVQAVAEEMKDFARGWYVSAGWAADLFLGRVTRVHHDVDVLIDRADQLALREYLTARGWKLLAPYKGRLEPWPEKMFLEKPRHQVHAFYEERSGDEERFGDGWHFIDFHLGEMEAGTWRYRRAEQVTRSLERLSLASAEGIPILAPEVVLLFKSMNTSGRQRPQDAPDFENVHPHLEPERRAWLLWALLETNPGHPWIERLIDGDWWR
jgi:GrpB-like predicted nucleotidyltransferase (UPF0157 family)